MRIAELPRAQYEGYELVFSYTCRAYYDVRMRATENIFSVELVRTPCAPTHKEFTDKIFAVQSQLRRFICHINCI